MIKVERIEVQEFRGIRELPLDLKSKSFAIAGPNGSGKSGVVDAIEFALTGNISRLSGKGSGDLSLTKHGPHVDTADTEKARVTLDCVSTVSGKKFKLSRTIKFPNSPTITPIDAEITAAILQLKGRPDFVLSRRHLIKYVLTTPAERADQVEALLRLDEIDDVRTALNKIAKQLDTKKKNVDGDVKATQMALITQLKVTDLSSAQIVAAANTHRQVISLPQLSEFTKDTSITADMVGQPAAKQKVQRAQALEDIQSTVEILTEFRTGQETQEIVDKSKTDSQVLEGQKASAKAMQKLALYKAGLALIGDDACPLCDEPWNPDELHLHINTKIDKLAEASKARDALVKTLAPFIASIDDVRLSIETIARYGANLTPPIPNDAPKAFIEKCKSTATTLTALSNLAEAQGSIDAIRMNDDVLGKWMESVKIGVTGLPDLSKQDAAREWLLASQLRLSEHQSKRRQQVEVTVQYEVAKVIAAEYTAVSNKVLSALYEKVQTDFAKLYAFINHDDEGKFVAKLTPAASSLALDVDFYGRGLFPPAAFHSEGHQDGMGLCLYLALMRHIHGNDFTFSVLDDVLMSVDAGHRRRVCELLVEQFPETQFIFTTHDTVWLRQMKSTGLIEAKASAQFKNWTVEMGPKQWVGIDVWSEIQQKLDADDVSEASAMLRNYLEFEASELCDLLRASVEFRGDGQYSFGQTLPAAVKALDSAYSHAKSSANSYGLKEQVAAIAVQSDQLATAYKLSDAEKWPMNASIHYNPWANFHKNDFLPVVDAMQKLLKLFSCETCNTRLRVIPKHEKKEMLTCDCGVSALKLKQK